VNISHSRTIDEDNVTSPRSSQSPKPRLLTSPKSARRSPRGDKPKLTRAPPPVHAPPDASDVFGETQTQASSDDSDREAELERRVRAAGAIGSVAVRTPAGGGLGSRMVRKKF
jgi:hypothetical protein